MKIFLIMMGLLLSPFTFAIKMQITKPISISVSNENQARVVLSSQDMNRVFVVRDKITRINTSAHRVIAHNDQWGSIFMNVMGDSPFTVFITTQKGRHFSLFVIPKHVPGMTVQLIPKTPVRLSDRHASPRAKQFEQSSPYEKTLLVLLRDVMLNHTPPGYSRLLPPEFKRSITFRKRNRRALSERAIADFLGGVLAIHVFRLSNHGSHQMTLIPREFYGPGVRAVAIARETISPHASTTLYEVVSNV